VRKGKEGEVGGLEGRGRFLGKIKSGMEGGWKRDGGRRRRR
jgi:hypothetical protein